MESFPGTFDQLKGPSSGTHSSPISGVGGKSRDLCGVHIGDAVNAGLGNAWLGGTNAPGLAGTIKARPSWIPFSASTGCAIKLRAWHEASQSLLSEPKFFGSDRDRLAAPDNGVTGAAAAWMNVFCTMLPTLPFFERVEGDKTNLLDVTGAAGGAASSRHKGSS